MRRYLVEMKPKDLANVIAMVALYRPGPMEIIPGYIRRMHGEEAVTYRHPLLEPILKETYGFTVYQEQIMYTAMRLGNFSASEADVLRKAVAKKKGKELLDQCEQFVLGAMKNGVSRETAKLIVKDWEDFARYGFPKGHAADYGVIAVRTAYLKAHYPLEYMTAQLIVVMNDTDRVAQYVSDCRRMGIQVLPPDINTSQYGFSIEETGEDDACCIRFGLGAIKNVGMGPVEEFLKARADGGQFNSLDDIIHRVDLRLVGKRALESLIMAGALDEFGQRVIMLDAIDEILGVSTTHFRAKEIGQFTLFEVGSGLEHCITLPSVSLGDNRRKCLDWERELLGLYLSDHPLAPVAKELDRAVTHNSIQLAEAKPNENVRVGGLVVYNRTYQTKRGDPMGYVTLEDLYGKIKLVVFPKAWEKYAQILRYDQIVLVQGRVETSEAEPQVFVGWASIDLAATPPSLAGNKRRPVERKRPNLAPKPGIVENPIEKDEDGLDIPEAFPVGWDDVYALDIDQEAGGGELLAMSVPVELNVEGLTEVEVADSAPLPVQEEAELVDDRQLSAGPLAPVLVDLSAQGAVRPLISPDMSKESVTPRMIRVNLRASGDKVRDMLRLRRIHGLFVSYPGQDRFALYIFETGRAHLIEFPNETTGICDELHERLARLVRVEDIYVEEITFL
jgi:DNA polymerase-3 subunit alpha